MKAWPRCQSIDGITVYRIGVPGRGIVAKLIALCANWWWLFNRRSNVSLASAMLDPDFAMIARLAGIPDVTMTWVTTGDPRRFLTGALGPLRRVLLRGVRHVVLTTKMQRELGAVGFPNATVIPVPVDPVRFPIRDDQGKLRARDALMVQGQHIILFVGHLQHRKGIDLLLEAFALLPDPSRDLRLFIVGAPLDTQDGRYEDQLWLRSSQADLRERVVFWGPRDDVPTFFQAADIFCLPSRREGMPNVLLEAMSSGLVCVAPPSAGGDEVLADGLGIVPPSNSPTDLANALLSVLSDPSHARQRGRTAATAARTLYAPTHISQQYEHLWSQPPPSSAPVGHYLLRRRLHGPSDHSASSAQPSVGSGPPRP